MDRYKAGTEPVNAGIIFVAARLVDSAFAPELGFDRHDRNAVRGFRAITAAFTNQIVDKDALCRIGKPAALTAAALFGGARLIVHNRSDTWDLAQLALHRVKVVAMAYRDAGWEATILRVFIGFVGDNDDAADAFGGELAGQCRHGQPGIARLPAGHCDGVVE